MNARAVRALAAAAALSLAPLACAQDEAPDKPEAPPPPDNDRIVAVLTLFASKCSECHGPQLPEPKGDFGYLFDLPRLVSEGLVVPGDPENSKLFRLMDRGKMPPKKAKAGPATPEQIDLVRQWIQGAAGPSGATGSADAPPASANPQTRRAARPLVLLGRLHPLVVHFPIGLLIAAVVADLIAWRTSRPGLGAARTFCAVVGALGAAAAAGLGWLNAWADHKSGDYLDLHRWLGTAAAVIAVLGAAVILGSDVSRAPRRAVIARIFLLSAAILVGIAAHFGGLMVFGGDYFSP